VFKISCRHLWKVYGAQTAKGNSRHTSAQLEQLVRHQGHIGAVQDVSFDVDCGEIFVIMGLSGSGKSTVVRCLSRLIEPTAGEVLFDGQDLLRFSNQALIKLRRHKMGMVFQGFGLLPHLSVLQNVAFPLRVQGVARRTREARAQEVIALVGLEGREEAFPRQLSGGQQQRVGIARSLAIEPDLWFLDEPFSALDPLIRSQMQDEFLHLQQKLRKTIVFITHDFLEALKLADRIAIMKEGRIVQIGTPAEIVLQPADSYVAEFTRDVPRTSLLQAGDCMDPLPRNTPAGPVATLATSAAGGLRVPMQTPLRRIIPELATLGGACWVVDNEDRPVGSITCETVVRALADAPRVQSPAQNAGHAP